MLGPLRRHAYVLPVSLRVVQASLVRTVTVFVRRLVAEGFSGNLRHDLRATILIPRARSISPAHDLVTITVYFDAVEIPNQFLREGREW